MLRQATSSMIYLAVTLELLLWAGYGPRHGRSAVNRQEAPPTLQGASEGRQAIRDRQPTNSFMARGRSTQPRKQGDRTEVVHDSSQGGQEGSLKGRDSRWAGGAPQGCERGECGGAGLSMICFACWGAW